MLVAILALVFVHYRASGVLTFGYADLLATPMGARTGFWIMLGFFFAFAVKLPVVPFHSWLPDAHSQAPTAGSVILAGVLLKTAAYGLLRYLLPLFPAASAQFAPIAMWLGVLGIVYGAVCAFGQNDAKRLVAYTSISHMGFIVLGVFAGTEEALQGVIMQILAHGISAAGLFILVWRARRTARDPRSAPRWADCGRASPTCRSSGCSSFWHRSACRGSVIFSANS